MFFVCLFSPQPTNKERQLRPFGDERANNSSLSQRLHVPGFILGKVRVSEFTSGLLMESLILAQDERLRRA